MLRIPGQGPHTDPHHDDNRLSESISITSNRRGIVVLTLTTSELCSRQQLFNIGPCAPHEQCYNLFCATTTVCPRLTADTHRAESALIDRRHISSCCSARAILNLRRNSTTTRCKSTNWAPSNPCLLLLKLVIARDEQHRHPSNLKAHAFQLKGRI